MERRSEAGSVVLEQNEVPRLPLRDDESWREDCKKCRDECLDLYQNECNQAAENPQMNLACQLMYEKCMTKCKNRCGD